MPATTYLPFESAKRRVEAGDFSFEALGALTVAHGEKLVRDMETADAADAEFERGLIMLGMDGQEAADYVRQHSARAVL